MKKINLRTIRSYVLRQGRLTNSQQQALEKFWPQYGLNSHQLCDFVHVFGNHHPVNVEIGFGNGINLLANASQNPQNNFIGIEVHQPGIGHLLQEIEKQQLTNIRIFADDAVMVLQTAIPDHSLNNVQIFFPDPWPKKRHHKRRLIQTEFIDLLAKKIRNDGVLELATDWQDYATHMLAVMDQHSQFINLAGQSKFSQRSISRPLTKFEKRGIKIGHQVFDLRYRRV